MKIKYIHKKFTGESKAVIHQANQILDNYAAQGFVLTLRQLYYQFVARDLLPNSQKSYNRLGSIVGDARLAGLIDWEYLEDRTRNLADLEHFNGPTDALTKLAGWYHVDMWENQRYRPEIWIEKDALVGVIRGPCQENDVPYFSCRGYTSLSEMWRASLRVRMAAADGQIPYIIHFGDHDPSGMDMSRDIQHRLQQTFRSHCEFKRVALTMDQIEKYDPPPNWAKVTDSRYRDYSAEYGDKSWELDALEPTVFRQLIESHIDPLKNKSQWKRDSDQKRTVKRKLEELAKSWNGKVPRRKK